MLSVQLVIDYVMCPGLGVGVAPCNNIVTLLLMIEMSPVGGGGRWSRCSRRVPAVSSQ